MENQTVTAPDSRKIEATLLRLVGEHGPGKTVDPTEIARTLGGPHPDGWGPLMQPIRRVAVALAEQGRAGTSARFRFKSQALRLFAEVSVEERGQLREVLLGFRRIGIAGILRVR